MSRSQPVFSALFSPPRHSACQPAHAILEGASESASSFEHIFQAGLDSSGDEDQDLLRAMLLFSSAGLDSMVKQLARDALPIVIELNAGAREQFRIFVERQLRNDQDRFALLSAAIVGDKEELQHVLISDLTAKSLQSVEELSRTAAYFDIATIDLIPDPNALRDVFIARNQIAHEMDVDSSTAEQRHRDFAAMRSYTEEIFTVACRYLSLVDSRLPRL